MARAYFLLCGNADCVNRTQPRPDYARAGWHVRGSELVDGEPWTCPDCRGVDWPKTTAPTWREEWVSWFVDGHAAHFLRDSPTGCAIRNRLAELERPARTCAVVGCSAPARGRSRACSDAHARTLRRVRAAKRPDLPDTAQTRTIDTHLPGTSRPDIADTADIPAVPERRCANCGADISDRRADARFCKRDACRKALARRAARLARRDPADLLAFSEDGA